MMIDKKSRFNKFVEWLKFVFLESSKSLNDLVKNRYLFYKTW